MLLGDVTGGIGQTAVYTGASVMSAAIIAGAAYVEKRRRSASKKLDQIYTLLAGEEASDLNPNPAPGLVAKVEQYQQANVNRREMGDQLMGEFADHKRLVKGMVTKLDDTASKVTTLTTQMDKVMNDVKALVADSKPNGGSTSKDQLNRIEQELDTKSPAVPTTTRKRQS